MEKKYYLDRLMHKREFRFDKLVLKDIDNISLIHLIKASSSELKEEETCIFHRDVSCGDDYFEILHNFIYEGLSGGNAAPIVRFADGEYAFYENSLHCNGLYQQAESVEAIKKVMPIHIEAFRKLNRSGKFAALINHRNARHKKKAPFPFFRSSKVDNSALKFIEFLFYNKIKLTEINYIPFYVVYAYLTSKRFSQIMDGKNLCIINSECNLPFCSQWFAGFSSHPNITFIEIPSSYVATQWASIKEGILSRIPTDTDLCLVGAGIGALLVCVDVAHQFSIPAIDAGHVLNMMNSNEDKSRGPRLYTIHKV